ncbi:heterokaryon incompatibility protein-domain-containing protein [Usnea florida]
MGLNIPSRVTVRPNHGDESRPTTLQLPPCAPHGSNATNEALIDNLDAIHLGMTQNHEHSYAALSYCWGPKQFPNLIATKKSFKGMLMNVPLMSFPLTLRDDITVAHELGLRYLWIDALCIIQDDDDNKNNEIPQMRRYFPTLIAQSLPPQPLTATLVFFIVEIFHLLQTCAFVNGIVANHRALSHWPFVADVFEVIDCVVVPEKRHTPLTTVKAAVLTVRGRMKTALLHIKSQLLFKSEEAHPQVVIEENYKNIYDLGPFAPLTSSIPGYHEMEVDFGTCRLDALEHEQYPQYRSVHCLEITSRVREGHVGNQQGLVLINAAAEGTFNRIGMFGTHALGENWFEDVVPQTVRIT